MHLVCGGIEDRPSGSSVQCKRGVPGREKGSEIRRQVRWVTFPRRSRGLYRLGAADEGAGGVSSNFEISSPGAYGECDATFRNREARRGSGSEGKLLTLSPDVL